MTVLNYIQKFLSSYSDLENSFLLRAGIISISAIILSWLIFFILIRIADKKKDFKYGPLVISLLQGLRIFTGFLIAYIFLRSIKSPVKAEYPLNLVYRGLELAVLNAGLAAAILKLIRVLKKIGFASSIESIVRSKLVKTSSRGINIIVILLVFSVFISQLKKEFSPQLQTEIWISLIVIINSVLLMVALFFAVEKILPQIQNYFKVHRSAGITANFLSVIAPPVRIFIITIFLISIKPTFIEYAGLFDITGKLIEITVTASVLLLIFNFINIFISRLSKYSELETNSLDKTLIELFRMIIRVCFVAAFVFLSIKVFTGKPLTSLLAGLGIGGLAVALAAQDTLKNFFGSIMIMTDKPFKVGERISAEGFDGVIESIGFRSTRIRTLTGNQVVIPNDRVAQAPIENIGRRQSLRRLTNITITYSTTPEKVEKALAIIRGILDNHEGMPPDLPPRVYFNEFNADSLNILVLYWYSPPDYWAYMQFSEEVNLKIMKMFAAEGIEFAFPTHTTYLEQEDGKSIKLDLTSVEKTH